MNFELSEQQHAFQDAAREFAAQEMAPHAAMWDEEMFFPRETIRAAGELGFCGVYSSPDCEGLGLGRLDAAIIFEELAMACPSTTAYITIHNMATWMITTFGREQIAREWGPALTTGQKLASYCLTEPGAGSDAGSLTTTAQKVGDQYLLNGAKAFVSGGGASDALVVMARTGAPGPAGITAFLVPTATPGVQCGRKEKKLGWNSQPTTAITFDDVLIPECFRLGEEGDGFRIAMKGLDGGRINIATCSIGAAQSALDVAQRYMLERRQFNKRLADFQGLQFKIADMVTDLVSARQMVRLAASKLDSGAENASVYCAMAKRAATDIGFRVCNDALQLHGGYGYMKDYPLERFMRDARVHQILEGTNEIMRVIVSRKILEPGATEAIR